VHGSIAVVKDFCSKCCSFAVVVAVTSTEGLPETSAAAFGLPNRTIET